MMMIYNMDEDLRGIIKSQAKKNNIDIEEYFNFVLLAGLYYSQTMETAPQDVENYYKGIKGIDIDEQIKGYKFKFY